MLFSVDIFSSVAVYSQIENQVQFAIASGKIKAGEQLPSVRELSERLEVNPNTVAKAYRDLEVMGLLYTRRGMGVFINKGVEAQCRERCRKRIVSRIFESVAEAKSAGFAGSEIAEVIDKSLSIESGPYGPTPPVLFQLSKKHK